MPRKGYRHTEEHNARIAAAVRRRFADPAEREKMSLLLKGRCVVGTPLGEKTRAKMRIAQWNRSIDSHARGYRLSDETKRRQSRAKLRAVREGICPIPVHPGTCGRRSDLGKPAFRSRWEANFARILNLLKARDEVVSWYYEPVPIPYLNGHYYFPDFLVLYPDGSCSWIEVKGYWPSGDRNIPRKLVSLYLQFPQERVIVVSGFEYATLRDEYAESLPHWDDAGVKFRRRRKSVCLSKSKNIMERKM